MRRVVSACVCLLVLSNELLAQVEPDTTELVPADVQPLEQINVARADTMSAPYSSTKSPGLALLLSAVLPGAGQVYNESYWKAPVALGLGLYLTSQWLHYNRLTAEARDRYQQSLSIIPGGDGQQLRLREFYKDQRDTFTWYLFIFYVVNLADAYVDASLYDFNVGDDLSVRLMPDPRGRLAIQLGF